VRGFATRIRIFAVKIASDEDAAVKARLIHRNTLPTALYNASVQTCILIMTLSIVNHG
jgi:hypothetical protein